LGGKEANMTASKFGNSATLILMSRSILLVLIVLITLTMITPHLVLADPLPCDIQGWSSCYNVGYQAGLANPGTNCPSSHSDNFCAGWEFGASSGGHIQNSNITAYILGSNAVKQQSTNAHTQAWLFGYYHGRDEGRDGFFDTNAACEDDQGEVSYHGVTTNLTADHNEDRCTDGYIKGWDSTCQQALRDPDAEHDIYGCPGVSDKTINHIVQHVTKLVLLPVTRLR
jgi:hypothetical protein